MVRPVRVLPLLAVLAAVAVALVAPGRASARVTPLGEYFQVVVLDRISDATFASLAERGAVGLLRPSYGPTTNRRRALAELVRGAEVNARLGGVPKGKPLIDVDTASVYPNCHKCIVVQLPPRGAPTSNDRLYRIAIIGHGFHGLLSSPTTHIPGLISVVDVAPTAVGGHPATTLSWTPSTDAVGQLSRLGRAIHSNNRLKFPVLFIVAGLLLALALLGVFGLVVMTDNRLGADGGGAIVLGIALAVLGMRLFRLGVSGFVGMLASAAVAVLWIVSRGLAQPGPNHLRSAFSHNGGGLLGSLESRVPLSYVPALHSWQLVTPLLLVLVLAFALAWRGARPREKRDVLRAFGVAVVT